MNIDDIDAGQNKSREDFEERTRKRNDPYGTLDVIDPEADDAADEWDESPESRGDGEEDESRQYDKPVFGVPIGTAGVAGGAPGSGIFLPDF